LLKKRFFNKKSTKIYLRKKAKKNIFYTHLRESPPTNPQKILHLFVLVKGENILKNCKRKDNPRQNQ